jgi:ATP-binding cassette, subfamily B, putative efflux pump
VQETINNVIKDQTVIIVAHRLSTVINADKIVVVQSGKIIGNFISDCVFINVKRYIFKEIGTHNELMKLKGHYFSLFNLQTRES